MIKKACLFCMDTGKSTMTGRDCECSRPIIGAPSLITYGIVEAPTMQVLIPLGLAVEIYAELSTIVPEVSNKKLAERLLKAIEGK
jgi:hypothetical protein